MACVVTFSSVEKQNSQVKVTLMPPAGPADARPDFVKHGAGPPFYKTDFMELKPPRVALIKSQTLVHPTRVLLIHIQFHELDPRKFLQSPCSFLIKSRQFPVLDQAANELWFRVGVYGVITSLHCLEAKVCILLFFQSSNQQSCSSPFSRFRLFRSRQPSLCLFFWAILHNDS